MRLFWSSRSPYARKVTVTAHELDLAGRIELCPAVVTLRSRNAEITAHNPLGQVPTLLLSDGAVLYDSRVICEYLCQLAGGSFLPAGGAQRLDTLRRQATGDGLLDALIRWYSERQRSEDPRSAEYVATARGKMLGVIRAADAEVSGWGSAFDLGHAALAVALSYCDFRFAEAPWRGEAPALAQWHAAVETRPSFRLTAFSAG